eukprot:c20923_g1_i2 orf=182-2485(+)
MVHSPVRSHSFNFLQGSPYVVEDAPVMVLSAEEKIPRLLQERCLNGNPRIQVDLDRINRLASLGLPQRVPCNNHGRGSISFESTVIPIVEQQTAKSHGLALAGKSNLLLPTEARKRKADRDAASSQDHSQVKQAESRPCPNARSKLDLSTDQKHRKAIDTAKELLGIQDKENIDPCLDRCRPESRKQASDRSGEKQRLQVSTRLHNAPNSRKVGSLLIKQSSKPRIHATGSVIPHYSPPVSVREHAQQADSIGALQEKLPTSCGQPDHQQADNGMLTVTDSMSISSPIQLVSVPSCYTDASSPGHANTGEEEINSELQDLRATSVLTKGSKSGVVLSSVKELLSSMNGLSLANSHEFQPPFVLETGKSNCMVESNKIVQGFSVDAQQHACKNAGDASVVCPVMSIPSVTACSITIRTASAPLVTSFTDENVQPLSPQNIKSLGKATPGRDFGILKQSQEGNISVVSRELACVKTRQRKCSPMRAALVENGLMKATHESAIPMSDEGAGKLIQHLHVPEKKGINARDANAQTKRQGEDEYFVCINGKRYQKLKKIGRGGSSEVYKVIDRDGNIYALKRIKLKGRDYVTARGFYEEIELLTRLHGKSYIIRLIDHEVTDKELFSADKKEGSHSIRHDAYIYMLLEYGEVDLATMLQDKLRERSQGDGDVDETWLRFYWRQIVEAVNTVHQERIMHADLKPANFLLVKGVLKLIDFGIAKSIQNDTTNIERDAQVGTLNYMSPEAFLMNEKDENGNVIKCSRSSDIWALG